MESVDDKMPASSTGSAEAEVGRPKRERKQVERIRWRFTRPISLNRGSIANRDLELVPFALTEVPDSWVFRSSLLQKTQQEKRKVSEKDTKKTPPAKNRAKKAARASAKSKADLAESSEGSGSDIDVPLAARPASTAAAASVDSAPGKPTTKAQPQKPSVPVEATKSTTAGKAEAAHSELNDEDCMLRKKLIAMLHELNPNERDKLTMKEVRRRLEAKTGAAELSLDAQKTAISKWVEEVMTNPSPPTSEPLPKAAKSQAFVSKKTKEKERHSLDEADWERGVGADKKPRQEEGGKPSKSQGSSAKRDDVEKGKEKGVKVPARVNVDARAAISDDRKGTGVGMRQERGRADDKHADGIRGQGKRASSEGLARDKHPASGSAGNCERDKDTSDEGRDGESRKKSGKSDSGAKKREREAKDTAKGQRRESDGAGESGTGKRPCRSNADETRRKSGGAEEADEATGADDAPPLERQRSGVTLVPGPKSLLVRRISSAGLLDGLQTNGALSTGIVLETSHSDPMPLAGGKLRQHEPNRYLSCPVADLRDLQVLPAAPSPEREEPPAEKPRPAAPRQPQILPSIPKRKSDPESGGGERPHPPVVESAAAGSVAHAVGNRAGGTAGQLSPSTLTPNSKSLLQYRGARHVGDILLEWQLLTRAQVDECWERCGGIPERFSELALARWGASGVLTKELLDRAARRLRQLEERGM